MKRRWEVRWYEHNLTQEKCRKFFYGDRSKPFRMVVGF